MRETPWGTMTYLQYKYRMEFEKQEYDEIDVL
jgi:N-acetylneuraminate synthase